MYSSNLHDSDALPSIKFSTQESNKNRIPPLQTSSSSKMGVPSSEILNLHNILEPTTGVTCSIVAPRVTPQSYFLL
jgi:hypothetical protein